MITTEISPKSLHCLVRNARTIADKRSDKDWPAYGAHIESYQASFSNVLQGERIDNFVKNRRSKVVIDLMGPSEALIGLFEQIPSRSKFGLAVSLEDLRSKEERERGNKLNIVQMTGDITKSGTWHKINKLLEGRKADLIMERALAGLNHLPYQAKFYAIMVNKVWKLLNPEGGMLLAEVPNFTSSSVNERLKTGNPYLLASIIADWTAYLRNRDIDISYSQTYNGTIKIVRKPSDPQSLPFLK